MVIVAGRRRLIAIEVQNAETDRLRLVAAALLPFHDDGEHHRPVGATREEDRLRRAALLVEEDEALRLVDDEVHHDAVVQVHDVDHRQVAISLFKIKLVLNSLLIFLNKMGYK